MYRRTRELRRLWSAGATLAPSARVDVLFGYMANVCWDDAVTKSWLVSRRSSPPMRRRAPAEMDLVQANPHFDPVRASILRMLANPRETLAGARPNSATTRSRPLSHCAARAGGPRRRHETCRLTSACHVFGRSWESRRDGSFRVDVLRGADHLFSSPSTGARRRQAIHGPRSGGGLPPGVPWS